MAAGKCPSGWEIPRAILPSARVFGLEVDLDEVVSSRTPPIEKSWQTVGVPKLVVIGDYRLLREMVRRAHAT